MMGREMVIFFSSMEISVRLVFCIEVKRNVFREKRRVEFINISCSVRVHSKFYIPSYLGVL